MNARHFGALFLFVVAIGLATPWLTAAAEIRYQVVVDAGAHDRENTPARVIVSAPKFLDNVESVTLTDEQGRNIICQVTKADLLSSDDLPEQRELQFIVPALKAGTKATYQLSFDPPKETASASKQFRWYNIDNEYSELQFGDHPVLRYMCLPYDNSTPEQRDETYKVFHHVYAPNESRLLTKGPGGKYPHHRGLYFGFNRITYDGGKECDTWHCHEGAYQGHEKFVSEEAGPVIGRHTVEIGWHGAAGERFAVEDRQLTAYDVPGGQMIDFESKLATTGGPIHLDGDPQHAGFHFRAVNSVFENTKEQTYYIRPHGKGEMGAEENWSAKNPLPQATNLPWKALSFVIDDKRYTVVYLDHPQNPKESRFSERSYGRFGSYFEYEVEQDKPLEVRYRVWVQDGELDAAKCQTLANDFVDPPKVTIDEVE